MRPCWNTKILYFSPFASVKPTLSANMKARVLQTDKKLVCLKGNMKARFVSKRARISFWWSEGEHESEICIQTGTNLVLVIWRGTWKRDLYPNGQESRFGDLKGNMKARFVSKRVRISFWWSDMMIKRAMHRWDGNQKGRKSNSDLARIWLKWKWDWTAPGHRRLCWSSRLDRFPNVRLNGHVLHLTTRGSLLVLPVNCVEESFIEEVSRQIWKGDFCIRRAVCNSSTIQHTTFY